VALHFISDSLSKKIAVAGISSTLMDGTVDLTISIKNGKFGKRGGEI
jgi:hypothetical protein